MTQSVKKNQIYFIQKHKYKYSDSEVWDQETLSTSFFLFTTFVSIEEIFATLTHHLLVSLS